ncbi:hypothetical protein OG984_15825 [Nocardioides sp. NBC_00368]|uniref:hypothetical protein n=1 Tax=Nocardioides sp. NBC_00368 TaxID=2976000 RepID=UPI002E1D6F5B
MAPSLGDGSADAVEASALGAMLVLWPAKGSVVGAVCVPADWSSLVDFSLDAAGALAAGSEEGAAAGAANGSSPGSGSGSASRSTSSTTPSMVSSESTVSAAGVKALSVTSIESNGAVSAALKVSSRESTGGVNSSSVNTPIVVTEACAGAPTATLSIAQDMPAAVRTPAARAARRARDTLVEVLMILVRFFSRVSSGWG